MHIGNIEKAYALKNQHDSILREIHTIEHEIDYMDAEFVDRTATSRKVIFSVRVTHPIMQGVIQKYIEELQRKLETIRKEIEAL